MVDDGSSADRQLLDQRQFQIEEIARAFGEPRSPKSVWGCKDCGGIGLFRAPPNFCPYCRSTQMRPVPPDSTP